MMSAQFSSATFLSWPNKHSASSLPFVQVRRGSGDGFHAQWSVKNFIRVHGAEILLGHGAETQIQQKMIYAS